MNDPRVTRVGKFIRNTSIDELPQLINVLKGDMSIVGNRPLPVYEAERLTSDQISKRFLAPAGLTGLWQVELRGKGGRMSEEDPTFTVRTDDETGQTVISGMGELHLDIIVDRLRREYKVDCNTGAPQVAYKEAIAGVVHHREVLKKQTGGKGKFADITVELSPADNGVRGLQFINDIKGSQIPKEYIPAVQHGFESSMMNGVLAGFPVDSLKVRLLDAAFHPVDSDALSFEIAARLAFKAACRKAKAVLLEPIMHVDVTCPEQYVGDVTGDLNKRRAQLEAIDAKVGYQIVKARVPLSEMFGYVTQLRSLSSGRATVSMEFSHYEPTPENLAEQVIIRVKGYVEKY